VDVTSFPPTDANGAGWDTFDGADIYIDIQQNGQLVFSYPNFYEDANLNTVYPFTIDNVYLDPSLDYEFRVYDYDDGITPDDYMGGISGKVYSDNNGFPSEVDITCTGCSVGFKLYVSYEF
jgi:hypothetical protein